MEAAKAAGRRVSLTGMLDFLGVSRSGYQDFLKHRPSEAELRKERVKERIQEIYDGSHQNYGAPKITRELQKEGERISERSVGTYMREMGIRAHIRVVIVACHALPGYLSNPQFQPELIYALWSSFRMIAYPAFTLSQ